MIRAMRNMIYALHCLLRAIGTLRRRCLRTPAYVTFLLDGTYEELPQSRPTLLRLGFAPVKPSLQDLARQFRQVGADDRVQGVVLYLHHLSMSAAQLQSLRDMIKALRAQGKRVITWAKSYDGDSYYVACAADSILLQPGGQIAPLGLRHRFIFLADLLERLGLTADILQISPYKSAADFLTRSTMSDEMREMMDWLMDDAFEHAIKDIAADRGCSDAQMRQLVDRSPLTDAQALEAKAVDEVLGEEDLPAYLGSEDEPARLDSFDAAAKRLYRLKPERPGPHVALIRIEGNIVDGRSQQPPYRPPLPLPFLFSRRAGDLTVVQQARKALADKRAAAVVVFINSHGGSATASEAMAGTLAKVAENKPLVVAMGSVAASGGYYAATPARWIVAQPDTITGSIGVLWGKIAMAGLLDKLNIHHETLTRGQHAALYDPARPFNEDERQLISEHIKRVYDVFLERVMAARDMRREQFDAIGGGRVWTGRQALKHGLVDELGGVEAALARARELAKLHADAPVREIRASKLLLPPRLQPADILDDVIGDLRALDGAQCLCPFVYLKG